jgi:lipopolysaccharide biosynthesis protein
VAAAKKLFIGHKQPHIPADLGFYDLRLNEVRKAQAELAQTAGIEGFCYWHYWFGGGYQIMENIVNEIVAAGEPDIPFCLAWANHSWEKKLWDSNGTSEVLIQQTYPGLNDHREHFFNLLDAFKDKRYIRVSGKVLFLIYKPLDIPNVSEFISLWRTLAKDNFIDDFYFIARDSSSRNKHQLLNLGFDAIYNDDVLNIHHELDVISKLSLYLSRSVLKRPTVFQYKKAIKHMISKDVSDHNVVPVVAPNWDHSPRSGAKAMILHNSKPKYFKKLLSNALSKIMNKPLDTRLIIVKSWNEWGEGNYLEPDVEFGHQYLDVVREIICMEE